MLIECLNALLHLLNILVISIFLTRLVAKFTPLLSGWILIQQGPYETFLRAAVLDQAALLVRPLRNLLLLGVLSLPVLGQGRWCMVVDANIISGLPSYYPRRYCELVD